MISRENANTCLEPGRPPETKLREDFAMKTIRIGSVAYALAIIASVSVTPSQAQPAAQSTQTALAKEARTLSDKFTGLAARHGRQVRLETGTGGTLDRRRIQPERGARQNAERRSRGRPAPITDPEKLQEALKSSYSNLQQTITGLSDADLKTPVKIFGRDMTKEDAVRYLFGDQHEHLGQSIAYARSNGVVPPWSK